MPETLSLPAAVEARPLTFDDAEAVFALTVDAERHDTGQALAELEDIRSDWAQPSYTLGEQSIGFFQDGELIAYSEVHRNRIEAYVHPERRGRGLGTTLFRWGLAKARELGYPRVGQTVPASNADAIAIFAAHGCSLLYTSWILELPEGVEISATPLPAGHRLRDFEPERDTYDVYRTFEDAFNEWPNRVPSTLEDWKAVAFERADSEPWQVLTVVEEVDGAERIVAACRVSCVNGEGWVDQIAVQRSARGRGLGRALLVAAFTAARAHGATVSRLNTDSRTGALGLYEHVGMQVVRTYEHYAVDLH
jgi:ribosomal protein S18 acetylase RimI-like enzyme